APRNEGRSGAAVLWRTAACTKPGTAGRRTNSSRGPCGQGRRRPRVARRIFRSGCHNGQWADAEHVVLVSAITVRTRPHLPPPPLTTCAPSGCCGTTRRAGRSCVRRSSRRTPCGGRSRAGSTRSVRVPHADIELPTVHPADIAAAAKAALTEPPHRGRTYARAYRPERVHPVSRLEPSGRPWCARCPSRRSAGWGRHDGLLEVHKRSGGSPAPPSELSGSGRPSTPPRSAEAGPVPTHGRPGPHGCGSGRPGHGRGRVTPPG